MSNGPVVEEVTLPAPILEQVALEPRSELGGRTSEERIAGLISLGRPIAMPVRPEIVKDKQLRAFLTGEKRSSRFAFVHIVISFHPSSQLLESVVVSLSLSHREGPQVPAPIAWSLSPVKVTTPGTVVDKVGLTAKLGVASYEASQTSEASKEDAFLVAVGERESDPEWRFTGTRKRPLVGVHGLSTVVQAPAGVQVFADLLVAATIRRPLGLTRYRAELAHDYSHLTI
jgi:hypothetical protein